MESVCGGGVRIQVTQLRSVSPGKWGTLRTRCAKPADRAHLGRSWLDVDAQPKLVVVPASKGINITVLRQGKRVMLSAREAHYSTALERGDK